MLLTVEPNRGQVLRSRDVVVCRDVRLNDDVKLMNGRVGRRRVRTGAPRRRKTPRLTLLTRNSAVEPY